MLGKRSRPVSSSKQTIICEHTTNSNNNFPAPNSQKSHKPTSFLFNSPRIFKDFFSSRDSAAEQATPTSTMSPSSVLETKPFSPPFWAEKQTLKPKTVSSVKHTRHSWEQPAIGLALIDDHGDEKSPQLGVGPANTSKSSSSRQRSKLVVFGSHLKIQIPAPPPPTSPQSAMEFGIKTPKTNLLGHVLANSIQQEEDYYKEKKRLLVKDMELSEDYTCVISHGPNPKTTHIFGNCIVKSCCGVVSNTSEASASSPNTTTQFNFTTTRFSYAPENFSFLSFCHHCNKKIGQGKDIYMYRGEKAFCSQECRGQEMLFDGIEC